MACKRNAHVGRYLSPLGVVAAYSNSVLSAADPYGMLSAGEGGFQHG